MMMRRFLFCLSVFLFLYGMKGLYLVHRCRSRTEEYRMIISGSDDLNTAAALYSESHPDFSGFLVFDSGILSVPVMYDPEQSLFYLDHDTEGRKDPAGVPFTFHSAEDPVITVFGHLVYYDEQAAFSPLQTLSDRDVCLKNRWFRFVTPSGTARYEIRSVIKVRHDQNTEYPVMVPEPDETWLNAVRQYRLEDEMTFLTDDQYMILQTCLRNVPDVHLLLIAVKV